MSVYSIYFSPTGGTKKVADVLASCFDHASQVDITVHSVAPELTNEDVCIVAVPSFGGRVPGAAVERIRQLRGNGAKAVAVVVYGNRDFDDTMLELKNELENAGFAVAAGVAAVAEHSIMHQFGAGRPDPSDETELRSFGEKIKEKIAAGQIGVQVPGKEPYREYGGVPMKPSAGSKCTACGLCAKGCPVGAIDVKNPKGVNKKKCISCMRCISVCPKKARKVSPLLLTIAGLKMKKNCSERKKNSLYL